MYADDGRHDFVVVETIDFYDDEDAQLPEPMTQRDVILLNKAAQEQEAAQAEVAEAQADSKEDNMEVRRCICCLPYSIEGVALSGLGVLAMLMRDLGLAAEAALWPGADMQIAGINAEGPKDGKQNIPGHKQDIEHQVQASAKILRPEQDKRTALCWQPGRPLAASLDDFCRIISPFACVP